jgi:hypothetical protein
VVNNLVNNVVNTNNQPRRNEEIRKKAEKEEMETKKREEAQEELKQRQEEAKRVANIERNLLKLPNVDRVYLTAFKGNKSINNVNKNALLSKVAKDKIISNLRNEVIPKFMGFKRQVAFVNPAKYNATKKELENKLVEKKATQADLELLKKLSTNLVISKEYVKAFANGKLMNTISVNALTNKRNKDHEVYKMNATNKRGLFGGYSTSVPSTKTMKLIPNDEYNKRLERAKNALQVRQNARKPEEKNKVPKGSRGFMNKFNKIRQDARKPKVPNNNVVNNVVNNKNNSAQIEENRKKAEKEEMEAKKREEKEAKEMEAKKREEKEAKEKEAQEKIRVRKEESNKQFANAKALVLKEFKLVKKQGLLTLHPNKGGNNNLFVKFKSVYEVGAGGEVKDPITKEDIKKMQNIMNEFDKKAVNENTVKPNNTVKSNLSKKFKSVKKQGLLTLHPNKGGNNVSFVKFKSVYENPDIPKDIQIQNMEKIIKEFQKPMLNKPNYLKLPNKPNVYEPVYNNNSNSNNKPVVGKKPGLKATLKISNNPLFEKNKKKPMNMINENPNEENKAVGKKISTLVSLKKAGANIRRINNAKKKLIGANPIYNNSNSNTENNIKPKKKGLLNNAIDKAILKKKLRKLTPLGGRAAEKPKPPNTPKPNKPSFRGLVQKNKEKRVMNAVKIASQKVAISQATGAERVKLSRKFAPKTQNNVNKLSGFGKLLTKNTIGNTRPRSERRVDNKERLKELKKVVKKKNPRLSPSKINMEARKMLKKEKGT